MISSISIINFKGDILIYRSYKDDITRSEMINFISNLVSNKNINICPVHYQDGGSYFYISQKDVFIIASSKTNANAGMIFSFLYTLVDICKAYFGGEMGEKLITKHYVLLQELLDEVIDYGIPQITEPEVLKSYIKEGGLVLNKLSDFERFKQITMQATGATSWRPLGIKYKKNNIYIDCEEKLNVMFSNNGTVIKCEVIGEILINSELSGMPECKLGINDKMVLQRDEKSVVEKGINMDDLKFHQCVKLSKFDKDRAITFIPPDGKFTLMNYKISQGVYIPFKLISLFDRKDNKIEYKIKLKSLFKKQFIAENIVLKIPAPLSAYNFTTNAAFGKAQFERSENCFIWRIKKFQGETEALLRCECNIKENDYEWKKPPLSLDFEVMMFTSSGIRIKFMKVIENKDYKTFKWIRYLTKSGEYSHRL